MIWRMLLYLDEDQPVKAIDLKDATFMLAKPWDVSPDTIQNCWRKGGFPEKMKNSSPKKLLVACR